MNIEKIKYTISVLMLVVVFNVHSIDNEYCLRLSYQISDQVIQTKILDWVDERFSKSLIKRKQVTSFYTGIRPGKYTYLDHGFNWETLKFSAKKSRIKLIGLGDLGFYEDYKSKSAQKKTEEELRKPASSDDVDSIFFSEKSYYGIIVKLNSSDEFIEKKHQKYLKLVSDRIGILCGSKYIRGQ